MKDFGQWLAEQGQEEKEVDSINSFIVSERQEANLTPVQLAVSGVIGPFNTNASSTQYSLPPGIKKAIIDEYRKELLLKSYRVDQTVNAEELLSLILGFNSYDDYMDLYRKLDLTDTELAIKAFPELEEEFNKIDSQTILRMPDEDTGENAKVYGNAWVTRDE